jgi:hypothetical protein
MTPQRIQLSRAKGWRKPANTVVVARPSRWGNPYKVAAAFDSHGVSVPAITADVAVALYRERLEATLRQWPSARAALAELRGKNLACWCKLTAPCHADVLLELANR